MDWDSSQSFFDFIDEAGLKMLALILSTFTTVFLAELGDKTQLATVALSGSSNKPLAVFIGSSSALVLASFFGAMAGGSMATVLPADSLQLIASVGFLAIGLKLLWPLVNRSSLSSNNQKN